MPENVFSTTAVYPDSGQPENKERMSTQMQEQKGGCQDSHACSNPEHLLGNMQNMLRTGQAEDLDIGRWSLSPKVSPCVWKEKVAAASFCKHCQHLHSDKS